MSLQTGLILYALIAIGALMIIFPVPRYWLMRKLSRQKYDTVHKLWQDKQFALEFQYRTVTISGMELMRIFGANIERSETKDNEYTIIFTESQIVEWLAGALSIPRRFWLGSNRVRLDNQYYDLVDTKLTPNKIELRIATKAK